MEAANTNSAATTDDELPTATLVRRLLALTWQYRWGCAKVILVQVAILGLGVYGLGLLGLGVDVVTFHAVTGAKPPEYPFAWQPPADWTPLFTVAVIAVAVVLMAALRALLNFTYTIASARLVQQQLVVDLRAQVYDKLQRLSFRFFDANASSTIINRVTSDVQMVRMFVDGVILQMVVMILSLFLYVGYMANIHLKLTVACLSVVPLLAWTAGSFSRRVKPAYRRNRELTDELIAVVKESVQGVHVVKGFAREEAEIEKFRHANQRTRDQQRWIFDQVAVFNPKVHFLTQISLMILLAYGGYLAIARLSAPAGSEVGISLGSLLVFAGLLQQFAAQVTTAAGITNTVQQSLIGARRVFEILDAPAEIHSPQITCALQRARGELTFQGLSFGYEPDSLVLVDVNLHVKPGQCVAILGATGSGKSTLLSLIPRFYDPTGGRITLDGTDLRLLDVEELRRNIGLVFQESFLFSTTIGANIAFGHPEATQQQIERAASIAAAHGFITALPRGYDTVLAESGSNLSGGQRQRLAIARAVLMDPRILLLDDPTAAIDPQTEDEIMTAMENAMEGRTTFVVAHRLSTLRRADAIVVLQNGRIVQAGDHEELMSEGGPYRAAARLQIPDKESQRLLAQTEAP